MTQNVFEPTSGKWAYANDKDFKYVGGIGMGALGGSTNAGGISGASLGNGVGVAPAPTFNYTVQPTNASCAKLGQGGVCICNVCTPACTMMDKTQQKWDALKTKVDDILYGTPPAATTGGATNTENQVKKSSGSFGIVAGIGVVIVVVTGIALSWKHSAKSKGK